MSEYIQKSKELLGDRLFAQMSAGAQQMTSMPVFGQQQPTPQRTRNVDVTKMDRQSLQDVIQYSGVNLKEEEENIRKADRFVEYRASAASDHRSQVEQIVNIGPLMDLALKIAERNGLEIDQNSLSPLVHGVQQYLIEFISKCAYTSRHRIDFAKNKFQIKVDNDPRKQLLVLDSFESELNDRQGDGDEPRAKKSKKRNLNEREDVAVKTRLANVTAAAALGIPQKSWMTSNPMPESFSASGEKRERKQEYEYDGISLKDVVQCMADDPFLKQTEIFQQYFDGDFEEEE